MKPKFILSKSKVLNQFNKVNTIADITAYSSKTNPSVTSILEDNTNCMFTLHFINELKHIQDKSRIFFLAQAWTEEQIRELYSQGINWFGVDNESDLDVFTNILENNDIKINLLLRLKIGENHLRSGRHFFLGMTSKIINEKIKQLKNHPKINHLGIHFHRITQNIAEWNYKHEISDVLNEETLGSISIMNIGGGLPAEYANTNMQVLPGIFQKINEFKQWLNENNIELMMEPGRFICAPSVKLVTQIISIYERNIIVNVSVYNSDTDAFVVPTRLKVENELSRGVGYTIKGITPCAMDLFRYRVYFDNPQVGDQLVFLNAGAYNFTTNFCDLEEIETEVVE
jgi:ornithine decarboxylase